MHHFISAITLPIQALFLQFLPHMYSSKFSTKRCQNRQSLFNNIFIMPCETQHAYTCHESRPEAYSSQAVRSCYGGYMHPWDCESVLGRLTAVHRTALNFTVFQGPQGRVTCDIRLYSNAYGISCAREFTSVCTAWHLSISPTFASQ